MQDPHEIRCQHCYAAYDLCNGVQCPHDVHSNVPGDSLKFGLSARGAAYVGFCDPDCRTSRAKGSRAGEYTDGRNPQDHARIRAAAYSAAESANGAIDKVVTISIQALRRILRAHGVTVGQILCIVFDVEREGK